MAKNEGEKLLASLDPKVLFVDIETSPLLGWFWSPFGEQNIAPSQIERDWNMLSWSASWGTDPYNVFGRSLNDDKHKKRVDSKLWYCDDYYLVSGLCDLLSEADIVIGHNLNKFDVPKIMARVDHYNLDHPTPYRKIDTLTTARGGAKHTFNRLDYLAWKFGYEGKIETNFSLWMRCVHGEAAAFDEMLEYNKQDVIVLYHVYLRLRKSIKNPPNQSVMSGSGAGHCPSCNAEAKARAVWDGWKVTGSNRFPVTRCHECGAQSRSLRVKTGKTVRDTILVPV
jgi:hypothetical protein